MTDPATPDRRSRPRTPRRPGAADRAAKAERSAAEDLSYREAQAALERSLVELQSDALDVERMTELYQQACAYADRCDTLLRSVEAEVLLWDPDHPDAPSQPLNP